jgi:hypothetical protein
MRQRVDRAAARQHRDVRAQRPAPMVERLGPVPELHERILHDVLGGCRLVQHVDGSGEGGGAVVAVGAFEGVWFSEIHVEKNLDIVYSFVPVEPHGHVCRSSTTWEAVGVFSPS